MWKRRGVVPFKGAVVIPEDDVKDGPVEQRLHLNLRKRSKRDIV